MELDASNVGHLAQRPVSQALPGGVSDRDRAAARVFRAPARQRDRRGGGVPSTLRPCSLSRAPAPGGRQASQLPRDTYSRSPGGTSAALLRGVSSSQPMGGAKRSAEDGVHPGGTHAVQDRRRLLPVGGHQMRGDETDVRGGRGALRTQEIHLPNPPGKKATNARFCTSRRPRRNDQGSGVLRTGFVLPMQRHARTRPHGVANRKYQNSESRREKEQGTSARTPRTVRWSRDGT
mmetsp:Transcript_68544/g.164013  ORF Transcript_68544/g.164013 Transcript_68544/m.164013 type:complete len:234 (-) Transcript_68544:805-1506(-)